MKKFLGMAILALSMVLASCGVSGGGVDNAPVCDDQAGTINGRAYDNETYKCWQINWWQKTVYSMSPEDNTDESDVEYDWGTEYQVRKTWENWKAAANVTATAYGYSVRSTGDFSITEAGGRDENSCYDTYGR